MEFQVFEEIRESFTTVKTTLNIIQEKKHEAYLDWSSTVCALLSSLSRQAQSLQDSSNQLLCEYASSVTRSNTVLREIEVAMRSKLQKLCTLLKCSKLALVEIHHFTAQVRCVTNIVAIQEVFLVTFEERYIRILRPVKARFLLLEQVFSTTAHPSLEIKKQLSKTTGLTIDQINNWFTVHRYRLRKKSQIISDRQLLRYFDF